MIDPSELLYSVDEYNQPIDPQPRKLSHDTGIWHRSCHVWIVNDQHQILCQQRSLLKDSNPGRWEPFFGGHLSPGQTYLDAASREVAEETGITVNKHDLHFFTEFKYLPGTEYQGIYIYRWNGDIGQLTLEIKEVQQAAWKTIDEVAASVLISQDDAWTRIGYESDILQYIKELD